MSDQDKLTLIDSSIDLWRLKLKQAESEVSAWQIKAGTIREKLQKLGDERATVQTSPLGL